MILNVKQLQSVLVMLRYPDNKINIHVYQAFKSADLIDRNMNACSKKDCLSY